MRETQSTGRQNFPFATLSNTDLTWTILRLNPGLRGLKLVTTPPRNYGTALFPLRRPKLLREVYVKTDLKKWVLVIWVRFYWPGIEFAVKMLEDLKVWVLYAELFISALFSHLLYIICRVCNKCICSISEWVMPSGVTHILFVLFCFKPCTQVLLRYVW
jgi:hypothetical protein